MSKELDDKAIEALIALALRPDPEPFTDADVEKFLDEWERGEHKLSAEDEAALERRKERFMARLKIMNTPTSAAPLAQPLPVSGETPRTDAAVEYFPCPPDGEPQPFVDVLTSATLEQELASLQDKVNGACVWLQGGADVEAAAKKLFETNYANQQGVIRLTDELATERAAREEYASHTDYWRKVAEAAEAHISELESENQNHAEHVLLERGLRQSAEAKSGDVAKALNAYPDSDLVSLATTLEATRRKAEVVFPLAQKLVEAVQRIHIGPEASDDCDVCRATKELAAALASVPVETKLTAFDILPLKLRDMETNEERTVAEWLLEVKRLRMAANPPQVDAPKKVEWALEVCPEYEKLFDRFEPTANKSWCVDRAKEFQKLKYRTRVIERTITETILEEPK